MYIKNHNKVILGGTKVKEYIIFTDSTSDLKHEQVQDMGVSIIPFPVIINEQTYYHYPDFRELGAQKFYEMLRNGTTANTAQINMNTFIEEFEKSLKEGKDVLYICFSSGLSGTFQSAQMAQRELLEKYKDNKIIIVDSKCASMGQGLLVYYAAKKKKEGASIEELAEYVEEIKGKICHWFTVDDLFHLKRGGRISSASAIIGTVMGVKPVLIVNKEGLLVPVDKVRGRKAALTKLVDEMSERLTSFQNQTIFISHGDSLEDAEFVADLVKERFGIENIEINFVGPVIGAHAGPGMVALFFIGKER